MTLGTFIGYLTAADIKPNDYQRFLRHVEDTEFIHDGISCKRWTGAVDPKTGYGFFGGPWWRPHRFVFLHGFGWLPKGRQFNIAHQCHHRWCVEYAHVECEPHHRNMNDLTVHARETCKHGHSKAEFGVLNKQGSWRCRECNRTRVAAYYAAHPDKAIEQRNRYQTRRASAGGVLLHQEPVYEPYVSGTPRVGRTPQGG